MLSAEATKSVVLVVLLLMNFGLGMIPVKLMTVIQRRSATALYTDDPQRSRAFTYKRVLSFLSCFAAGVFLSTCLLDLLPGVRRHLNTAMISLNMTTGFPLAEFILSIGLFIILIVEQIVLTVKERQAAEKGIKQTLLSESSLDGTASCQKSSEGDFMKDSQPYDGISDKPLGRDEDHSQEEHSSLLPGSTTTEASREDSEEHHYGHHHNTTFQNHSPLRALLMLIALSIHSIFEGLAVGLQPNVADVLGIFAALVVHKSILSFSLGMNLVQSRLSTKICIRSIFFFSLTSPIGIAIGILITNLWESVLSSLVDGILQGVASGTFLYVTFFEVLPSEFNSPHDRLFKLIFLMVGYGIVSGILFFSNDVTKPFCNKTDTEKG